MEKSGSNAPQRSHRFGFAEMLRDVLVTSIERGQFLSAMVSLIVITIVVKLPADLMSALFGRFLESLDRGCVLGYVAATALAVPWIWRWRWRNRTGEK